mgnify:CR=1 FL=1
MVTSFRNKVADLNMEDPDGILYDTACGFCVSKKGLSKDDIQRTAEERMYENKQYMKATIAEIEDEIEEETEEIFDTEEDTVVEAPDKEEDVTEWIEDDTEPEFLEPAPLVELEEDPAGYADAKVYKAENYSFEYEDNSIVSLSGAAVAELYSYRPTMMVKDGSEVISEGIHIVEWKYDSKVFAEPITWYEVYVGVPEDILLKEADHSEESLISEKTYNSHSTNEIQKEAKHKSNPLLFVLFIIATVLVVFMVIRKKAHENAEPEQETFYYRDNECDENIIDVEYKEVDDEKD